MCWNEHVSLNTFLFSVGVIALVAYNQYNTPYKVTVFTPPYLFAFSFVSMQLIECLLWRNLKFPYWNTVFSMLGLALLFVQPITAMWPIKNPQHRWRSILLYMALFVGLTAYYLATGQLTFTTTQTPYGHLAWHWSNLLKQPLLWAVWLFFFFMGLVWADCPRCAITGFVLLLVSAIGYLRDGSFQSLWCWMANIVSLGAAIQLLILLPMKR